MPATRQRPKVPHVRPQFCPGAATDLERPGLHPAALHGPDTSNEARVGPQLVHQVLETAPQRAPTGVSVIPAATYDNLSRSELAQLIVDLEPISATLHAAGSR